MEIVLGNPLLFLDVNVKFTIELFWTTKVVEANLQSEIKWTENRLLNIIGCIFNQFEYFGSEIWKVNFHFWIFYNENVCEMFWI